MKNKLIILTFLAFTISTNSFSQDHFESKMKKMNPVKLISLMTEGASFFYNQNIAEKTLFIPEYNKRSIIESLVSKENKKEVVNEYENNWKEALDRSAFMIRNIQVGNLDYNNLTDEERKSYVFLSYYETMGYKYALLWYLDENNRELPATMFVINDMDFGNKNDLSLLLNILNQNLLFTNEYIEAETFEHLKSITEDNSLKNTDKLISLSTEDIQDAQNDFNAKLTINYASNYEDITLLIPEELNNKQLEKSLKKWKYSSYKFMPASEIEKMRTSNEEKYAYIKVQQAGKSIMKSVIVYLLSTNEDRILYKYSDPRFKDTELKDVIVQINKDISEKIGKYDTNSSIKYGSVNFSGNSLPVDIKTSKICFVKLNEKDHKLYKKINKSFEKIITDYPFDITIIDNYKDVDNYKYRVFLKSFMQTNKKTTEYYKQNRGLPIKTKIRYKQQELFYLYLDDVETSDKYKFQPEPQYYSKTFKEFVKESKKQI